MKMKDKCYLTKFYTYVERSTTAMTMVLHPSCSLPGSSNATPSGVDPELLLAIAPFAGYSIDWARSMSWKEVVQDQGRKELRSIRNRRTRGF